MAESINANSDINYGSSYCAIQDDRTKGAAEGVTPQLVGRPASVGHTVSPPRRPLRTDRGCHDARVTTREPALP